jgi:biopolymer transport protein ExbD
MHTLNELNVTPLLDLAFVLLLIFMITTPLMENSTDLVLPSGVSEDQVVDPVKVQTVSVFRDNQLTLNAKPIGEAELVAALRALRATKPDLAVVIRAHKEQSVQKLSDVLDLVKSSGVTTVGFVKAPDGM